jgi:hypothetical protein
MKIKINTDKPIQVGQISITPSNGLTLTSRPIFDDLGNIFIETTIYDGDDVENLTNYFSHFSHLLITDYSGANNPKGSNVVHLLYDWIFLLIQDYCVAELGFAKEEIQFISY